MTTFSPYSNLLAVEPLPFSRYTTAPCLYEIASDPFFQSVLQLLLTIDDSDADPSWPNLPTISIPAQNTVHILTPPEGMVTPDDQRSSFATLPLGLSPGGSRKRLRVDTFGDKGLVAMEGEDDSQVQKRLLTNSRRDAVAQLREEARALETTLKGLHLRQSRPKPAPNDDPDALIKSYAENIQLKRAIEEQDAKIKSLKRAVSLREGRLAPTKALF